MTTPFGSVATNDGRYYERNGRRYLSVTNIIDHMLSKPALIPWAVKLTAEAALEDINAGLVVPGQFDTTQRPRAKTINKIKVPSPPGPWDWKAKHTAVKDASADRGSLIHDWADRWTLGQEPDPPPGLEAECLGVMRAHKQFGLKVIASESTIYNDTYGFAGTGDLIAEVGEWDGAIAVLDYKTGKNVWPETAFQLAAYRNGEFVGLPDGTDTPMPATSAGGVLHVVGGDTLLIPYKSGAEVFNVFGRLALVAQWWIENKDSLVGERD